jgi:DNA-binding transcriptional regulator YdaS (Cro superfamily)
MTLSEYIKSFPRNHRATIRRLIADELNISKVFVRSMCNGNKAIPAKYAIRIEQITNGLVPRYVTAPEFYPVEK